MANSDTLQKQDGFKSQFGFIMAAVGSCVGMANVWRFPMLVSRYGGLTFLIPYAIFAFITVSYTHLDVYKRQLQVGDGLAQIGLGDEQLLRRLVDAALLRHGHKVNQLLQLHRVPPFSVRSV